MRSQGPARASSRTERGGPAAIASACTSSRKNCPPRRGRTPSRCDHSAGRKSHDVTKRIRHDRGDIAAPACYRVAAVEPLAQAKAEAAGRNLRVRRPTVRCASRSTAPAVAAGAGRSGLQNRRDQTPPASTTDVAGDRALLGDHAADAAGRLSPPRGRRSRSGSLRPGAARRARSPARPVVGSARPSLGREQRAGPFAGQAG